MEKINELVNENLVEVADEALFVEAPETSNFGRGLAFVAVAGLIIGGIYFGVKKFKKSKAAAEEAVSCGDCKADVNA